MTQIYFTNVGTINLNILHQFNLRILKYIIKVQLTAEKTQYRQNPIKRKPRYILFSFKNSRFDETPQNRK